MNNKDIFDAATCSCNSCDSVCFRENGIRREINVSDNVKIIALDEGLDVIVDDNAKETIYMPVVVSENGLEDKLIVNYHIGKKSEVIIYGSCIVNNNQLSRTLHQGLHNFYVEESSNVIYNENHLGYGNNSNKVINTKNIINLGKNSSFKYNSIQLENVNDSNKEMIVNLEDNSTMDIVEKIKTSQDDEVFSKFDINLDGLNSSCKLISRIFASDDSRQQFVSNVNGNNSCFAHVECDAILSDNAKAISIPGISANNVNAQLEHEASIGKINKEQVIKLMTLGYSEKEAEEKIIKGFLDYEM